MSHEKYVNKWPVGNKCGMIKIKYIAPLIIETIVLSTLMETTKII